MKAILLILLCVSGVARAQTTKPLYGTSVTNVGTNMFATMNGSDSVDRYRNNIGRKLFSRIFVSLDSIETITSIGSDWIQSLDATTGKFKKISQSNFLSSGNVVSGTYTPTLTNAVNIDASTAFACQYMRVGNTVTVSGRITIDATASAADTQLGISLPIASELGNDYECAGVAANHAVAGASAAILGDATNNRALMEFVSAGTTGLVYSFTFTYQIILP